MKHHGKWFLRDNTHKIWLFRRVSAPPLSYNNVSSTSWWASGTETSNPLYLTCSLLSLMSESFSRSWAVITAVPCNLGFFFNHAVQLFQQHNHKSLGERRLPVISQTYDQQFAILYRCVTVCVVFSIVLSTKRWLTHTSPLQKNQIEVCDWCRDWRWL